MRANTRLLVPLLIAMQKAVSLDWLNAPHSTGSTPKIPHHRRHSGLRIHAPNDGRWHMKFHRSRV